MVLCLLVACKKEHTGQDQAATRSLPVRITRIESYMALELAFSYNSDSTLKSITSVLTPHPFV